MFIRYSIVFFIILFATNCLQAQYVDDALRLSQTLPQGTARIRGLGGAQISLGGDISSASSNPAGLGFFNQSEFTFSPSLRITSANANYLGTNTEDGITDFSVPNLGLVINKSKDDLIAKPWRGGSFAISINQIDNFDRQVVYRGSNPSDDLIDFVIERSDLDFAEGKPEASITQGAFQAYLIDLYPDVADNGDTLGYFYGSELDQVSPDFPSEQTETITTQGRHSVWNLAYGGNFSDKFYIGASIGFTSVDYQVKREYQETRAGGDILNNYILDETRELTGSGIGGTIGVIYRPITQLTVGLTYKTPTFYNLDERSVLSFEANWDNFTYPSADSPLLNRELSDVFENRFDYRLTTPQRVSGGLSYFFGKYGFVTGDVEWIDYASNRLRADDGALSGDNDAIKDDFASAVNVRVGGEFRYNVLRVRAGYSRQGNPYTFDDVNESRDVISGGLGFRTSKYYGDLAFARNSFDETVSPYVFADGGGPVAQVNNGITTVTLTFGFTF